MTTQNPLTSTISLEQITKLFNKYDIYTSYIDDGRTRRDKIESNQNILKIINSLGYGIEFVSRDKIELIELDEPIIEKKYKVSWHTLNTLEDAEKEVENHELTLLKRVEDKNDLFTQEQKDEIMKDFKIITVEFRPNLNENGYLEIIEVVI